MTIRYEGCRKGEGEGEEDKKCRRWKDEESVHVGDWFMIEDVSLLEGGWCESRCCQGLLPFAKKDLQLGPLKVIQVSRMDGTIRCRTANGDFHWLCLEAVVTAGRKKGGSGRRSSLSHHHRLEGDDDKIRHDDDVKGGGGGGSRADGADGAGEGDGRDGRDGTVRMREDEEDEDEGRRRRRVSVGQRFAIADIKAFAEGWCGRCGIECNARLAGDLQGGGTVEREGEGDGTLLVWSNYQKDYWICEEAFFTNAEYVAEAPSLRWKDVSEMKVGDRFVIHDVEALEKAWKEAVVDVVDVEGDDEKRESSSTSSSSSSLIEMTDQHRRDIPMGECKIVGRVEGVVDGTSTASSTDERRRDVIEVEVANRERLLFNVGALLKTAYFPADPSKDRHVDIVWRGTLSTW